MECNSNSKSSLQEDLSSNIAPAKGLAQAISLEGQHLWLAVKRSSLMFDEALMVCLRTILKDKEFDKSMIPSGKQAEREFLRQLKDELESEDLADVVELNNDRIIFILRTFTSLVADATPTAIRKRKRTRISNQLKSESSEKNIVVIVKIKVTFHPNESIGFVHPRCLEYGVALTVSHALNEFDHFYKTCIRGFGLTRYAKLSSTIAMRSFKKRNQIREALLFMYIRSEEEEVKVSYSSETWHHLVSLLSENRQVEVFFQLSIAGELAIEAETAPKYSFFKKFF